KHPCIFETSGSGKQFSNDGVHVSAFVFTIFPVFQFDDVKSVRTSVNSVQETETNNAHPRFHERHCLQNRIEFVDCQLRLLHRGSRRHGDVSHDDSAVFVRDESGRSRLEHQPCKPRHQKKYCSSDPFSLCQKTKRLDVLCVHPIEVRIECDE